MSDVIVGLMALFVVLLLLSQLAVLGSINAVRRAMSGLMDQLIDARDRKRTAQFETEAQLTSRRVKYRAATTIVGRLETSTGSTDVDLTDMSETGVQIHGEAITLVKDESYVLEFSLPPDSHIRTFVRIVRELGERRYGACFEELALRSKRMIGNYVNKAATTDVQSEIPLPDR